MFTLLLTTVCYRIVILTHFETISLLNLSAHLCSEMGIELQFTNPQVPSSNTAGTFVFSMSIYKFLNDDFFSPKVEVF